MNIKGRAVFLMVGACTLVTGLEAQTTWHVDVNGTPPGTGTVVDPYTSVQYAHDQAATVDFDTVLVAPGEYVENVTLSKRIVVRSTGGAEVTTLRPAVAGPILRLNGPFDEPESITFEGFTITGVFGPPDTGAVRSIDGKLVRCIVRGNRGGPYRGVDTVYDSFLDDCTVVDNDVGVECSFLTEGLWMRNCIVWGNTINHAQAGISFGTITYCAGGPFFPNNPSPTNINGDPGMWGVAGGDYRLKPGSPCIDTGSPALPNDPDGSIGDIGYHAFDPLYAPIANYCSGKMNSHGCVPVIAGSGLPSLTSANPFLVTASLVLPFRRGVLLYSVAQDSAPFQGATLCVAQPYRRVGGQTSVGAGTCGGVFSYDFNIRIQSGVDPNLVPGAFVYAQWWHRDPNDPAGFQSGMTDGLCFGIAP